MAAVSQGLIEFANHFRQPPAPGVEVIETPRYRITIVQDYPIPGPNAASWISCRPEESNQVIDEVREVFAARRLPFMWILNPEIEPKAFPRYLAARAVHPDPTAPESAVMVLPVEASIESPRIEGLEMRDALADAESFRSADAVNAEAFGDAARGVTAEQRAGQERRRQDQIAARNRRVLLATIDGEPAGSSGMTLFPEGAIINGGAVREKFRGRGIYRAMVAERLRMAREAGTAGLVVWGGPMSAPILSKLGFEKVGWRRFYLDLSTAPVGSFRTPGSKSTKSPPEFGAFGAKST
ncbi:MAG TPA: GNAT family N-acetyltransferase [Candidatus Dormibacteraeota bacterium]|nr:GNAT family N-acetyltransferase [Candidatus Dormibacteraeota bacterium]